MSKITPDTVKKIAHLARLSLSENEIPTYTQDIDNILNLVNQMLAVDTANVKPMKHAGDALQRMRDDQITETNERDCMQSIAPETLAGLYLVPKVIE